MVFFVVNAITIFFMEKKVFLESKGKSHLISAAACDAWTEWWRRDSPRRNTSGWVVSNGSGLDHRCKIDRRQSQRISLRGNGRASSSWSRACADPWPSNPREQKPPAQTDGKRPGTGQKGRPVEVRFCSNQGRAGAVFRDKKCTFFFCIFLWKHTLPAKSYCIDTAFYNTHLFHKLQVFIRVKQERCWVTNYK